MNIINSIQKFLGGKNVLVIKVQCGAFNCENIFEIKQTTNALPNVPICPPCEARFNRGIQEFIHANSGHTDGSFHIIDGWSKK